MIAKRLCIIAQRFAFSTQKKFRYTFDFASHMIPHPAKAYKGGQDAIYVSKNLLVVADGVGGWADSGIDPGLYSKQLCRIIGNKIEANLSKYIDDPVTLLCEAVKQNKQLGSTTVCILALNPDNGNLINYYLGDSIMVIFYPNQYLKTKEQQKSFNFPYQVGSVGDDPSTGVLIKISAQQHLQGTFLLASDGVWDNYTVQSMRSAIFDKFVDEPLEVIAKYIAGVSHSFSLSEDYESPFYLKALEIGIRTQKSGKTDDISVILGRIIKQQL